MRRLLQHLIAHEKTSDDWIVIYDSRGTFSRIIGDCILMDSRNPSLGVFLGVPVWRERSCRNRQLADVEFSIRMKRQYLKIAMARIKELIVSCT